MGPAFAHCLAAESNLHPDDVADDDEEQWSALVVAVVAVRVARLQNCALEHEAVEVVPRTADLDRLEILAVRWR